MITETVGTRRLDALDGRDLDRWFAEWSAPLERGGRQRLAAARMAMIVLKTALSFGISCRLPGCAELKLILQQKRFPAPPPPNRSANGGGDCRCTQGRSRAWAPCCSARLRAAVRGRNPAAGRNRRMGAARLSNTIADCRRYVEMDWSDVGADRRQSDFQI